MSHEAVSCRVALLILLALSAGAGATELNPDPSDPNAKVPSTVYESVLPQSDVSSVSRLNEPQLPWQELYEPGGKFVPETALDGMASSQMMSEESMTDGQMSHENMGHGDDSGMVQPFGSSDARGIVKKIYLDDGKVKLEHGPIDKLGMPGMTMIFYVKDPVLMKGLNVGEEVGFDVELDGTTFYITGFER